jgi:hypothetical protein
MILAELAPCDREALVRFYLREREPEEICVDLKLTSAGFDTLRANARARFRTLGTR